MTVIFRYSTAILFGGFLLWGAALVSVDAQENSTSYSQMPSECSAAGITDPQQCYEHMMREGALLQASMPEDCKAGGITDPEACERLMIQKFLPEECKNAGITDDQGCRAYIAKTQMPEECARVGVTDRESCERLIFEKLAPNVCIEKGLTTEDACDKYISTLIVPEECIDAGFTENREACFDFLDRKYGGEANIPPSSYPPQCVSAGIKTVRECESLVFNKYAPKECQSLGFGDVVSCENYLSKKYLPKECVAAGVTARDCDSVMFKKFAPKDCVSAGITDEQGCRKYMTKKFAPRITCEGLGKTACEEQVERNHIGKIVTLQERYKEIAANARGGSTEVSTLGEGSEDLRDIIPLIRESARIVAVPSEEMILLNVDDNLVQTAPIALMIDSDGDKLPDDIEARLGTDSHRSDTDGDGANDRAEVSQNQNPLGGGSLTAKLSPIETAIIEEKTLQHPVVSGSVTSELRVERAAVDTESHTLQIEGTGQPSSVMTVYIYSDLPLVVTVTTDEYGNWKYEMAEQLSQTEHEIYVVVNDRTGKVVKKSNPLAFLIPEAQAVGVDDLSVQRNASGADSNYWLYAVSIMLLVAGGYAGYTLYLQKRRP